MTNTLKNVLMASILIGTTFQTLGNDIFIETRGPTEWQIDARAGYSEKKDSKGVTTKTTTQNDILKYWNTMFKNGTDEFGVFAFANVPAHKSIYNGTSESAGFGDFTFGTGPRFSLSLGNVGSLHGLTYGGAILPTGEMQKGKSSLTNDRTDIFAGGFFTYFPDKNRTYEVDLSVQYNFAEENSKGVKGKDTISGGLIAGGKIFDSKRLELRLAWGINAQFREDGAHSYGPRAVLRITPKFESGKKVGHLELIGDYDFNAKGMPKGYSLMTQLRFNF